MTQEELKKQAAEAVWKIKNELPVNDVIKDYHISDLMNINTYEITGISVTFKLCLVYDYPDSIINGWKKSLNADGYYIKVTKNQLRITFSVHYK